jgi:hypothetical protein
MIKDEKRLTLAFETPPDDTEQAAERIQLMFEDPERIEFLRRASVAPPETDEEASKRVLAAGPYPTNLAGSRWNNVDELAKALREHGWAVDVRHIKKYGEAFPRAYEVVLRSPNHGVVFLAVSRTELGTTEVACAKVLHSSDDEWKREANG